jgi:hypothetical protein
MGIAFLETRAILLPESEMNSLRDFLAFLALMTIAPNLGCGDACQLGEGKCEGNKAWICNYEGHEPQGRTIWSEYQDCGARVCKASSHGAVCSLAEAKDPLCDFTANSWPGAGVCVGSVPVQCALGYRVEIGPDCQSPALCQPDGFPFICSTLGGWNPICQQLEEPNLYVRTSCYNNDILFCREGRLLSYTDCANSQCGTGAFPPPGAEWCEPSGKCVPYAPEPVAGCQP